MLSRADLVRTNAGGVVGLAATATTESPEDTRSPVLNSQSNHVPCVLGANTVPESSLKSFW